VQAATNTELITFGEWTLRVRASQSENPRLLVLLHGWTGDENSMWIFTRALSPDYWMIAPRGRSEAAPYGDLAAPGGYSWRNSRGPVTGLPSLEVLRESAEALIKLADEYSASVKINSAQFDLMGFSQGAAVANVIGMLYPQRVRKMGVLAGFVPAGMEEIIKQKPLAGKNIFVAHGTQDQMIPIGRARASIAWLEQAGARITYCEDDVAHKVSASCLRALESYLRD
jgi:phospholipase/carboxylesterase